MIGRPQSSSRITSPRPPGKKSIQSHCATMSLEELGLVEDNTADDNTTTKYIYFHLMSAKPFLVQDKSWNKLENKYRWLIIPMGV